MAKTKKEWQDFYGFTDEEMAELELRVKGTNGTIVAVVDNPDKKLL